MNNWNAMYKQWCNKCMYHTQSQQLHKYEISIYINNNYDWSKWLEQLHNSQVKILEHYKNITF